MKKFAYYILMIFAVAIFFWNFSAKTKWPDPWEYLFKLTGPEIFSAIALPFFFVILNIMGKAIPNLADIKSPGARTQSLLNTISAYTDLSLVSIASVFCAYQFLPEEKEITKSMVRDFILWLLFTIFMFILACLLAGLSGQKSRLFRDRNSIIGVHIPNALGIFSIFISSIICIKMGVK